MAEAHPSRTPPMEDRTQPGAGSDLTVPRLAKRRSRASSPGIVVRHRKHCASRAGGECSCHPSFQAQAWSARDRKHYPVHRVGVRGIHDALSDFLSARLEHPRRADAVLRPMRVARVARLEGRGVPGSGRHKGPLSCGCRPEAVNGRRVTLVPTKARRGPTRVDPRGSASHGSARADRPSNRSACRVLLLRVEKRRPRTDAPANRGPACPPRRPRAQAPQ